MLTDIEQFQAVGSRAVEFIPDQSVIGLGSGRTTAAFIHALGKRVAEGLRVRGVPTSNASAKLARQLNIPIVMPNEVETLDIAVDGADEVDPAGNMIKGHGGALVREKIVAASAKKLIIVVSSDKLVPVLGSHGLLPVEVVPFGLPLCQRWLTVARFAPRLRMEAGQPFVSDNGNNILDLQIQPLQRPLELEARLKTIPGVVGTGLFLEYFPTILIQRDDAVEVREYPRV